MKFKKLVTAVLCMSLGMSVLCCGCDNAGSGRSRRSRSDEEEEELELPEDEILVVCRSENEAWGHYSSISFVTSDGSIYCSSVDFGFGRNWDYSRLTYEEELKLLQKYTEPIGKMDEETLEKLYGHLMKIDTDAEFKYSDEVWYDAGSSIVEVMTSDGDYIKINESGCKNGELRDRNARKAMSVIRNCSEFRTAETVPACYLHTDTYIETFPCTGEFTGTTHMIITNINELNEFEDLTGIDLKSIDGFEYFGDADYDHFNWACIAVEITCYDEYLSKSEISPDAFIVSESYVGFGILEDPEIDISDRIVEQNYYCHIAVVPSYDLSVYDPFVG